MVRVSGLNSGDEDVELIGTCDSINVDEHYPGLHLNRINFQVDTRRRTLGSTGSVVKATIVLRAFDDVIHYQSIGQMYFFMGAHAIGGIIFIGG